MSDKSLPNLAQLMEENVAYSQDLKVLRSERDHWKRVCEETEDRAAEVRAQLAAAQREADRLRHGEAIEGDFVCPEGLRADALAARLEVAQRVPADAELDALVRDLDDSSYLTDDVFAEARDAITALRRRVAEAEAHAHAWCVCRECIQWRLDNSAIANESQDA